VLKEISRMGLANILVDFEMKLPDKRNFKDPHVTFVRKLCILK